MEKAAVTTTNGNGNGESTRADRARAAASRDDAATGLESMIEDLRTAVKERDRYHAVLQKITDLIRAELEA